MLAAASFVLLATLIVVWGVIVWAFRDTVLRLWREPVLRHPVLIVESDDWGPGSEEHAAALSQICDVLASYRDDTGRSAVMTIGVILSVPDIAAMRDDDYRDYARKTLRHPDCAPMRQALLEGRERGVLALQLHGLEHLWPPAFTRAATVVDGEVRRWLEAGDEFATESLPAPIQSRWTNASTLPSKVLDGQEIEAAVGDEVQEFQEALGEQPEVIVPPTFVWNERVEQAWAARGLKVLVTPGRRYVARDLDGRPGPVDRSYLNGEMSSGGMICLVRDIYFEPKRGHVPERAIADAVRRFRLARPALVETHRDNFLGDPGVRANSVAAVDRLFGRVLEERPSVRFMSSLELAHALRLNDGNLIENRFRVRLRVWLLRLWAVARFRKLAVLSGLAFLPGVLLLLASRGLGRSTGVPSK